MATKKKSLVFGTRVGVLGGGQLARMLALKAHEMGLEVHVLSPDSGDPAAQVCRHWQAGDPGRIQDLEAFFRKVDLVTIESEFLDAHLLKTAEAKTKTPLHPRPDLLARLQDRLPQKELLTQQKLPTAEFIAVSRWEDIETAVVRFGTRFVLKKRRGGYDGYGTVVIKSPADLAKLKLNTPAFFESGWIAEAFIPFRRELSLVAVRSLSGEVSFLPLVQTHQVDSRLDWLTGPIRGRSNRVSNLQKLITRFLKKIDYIGVIAFELFETAKSELLINEIAPRVHNSGHASLEALTLDQFTLQWRALLGLSVKTEPIAPAFALVNLIGTGKPESLGTPSLSGHLHWYGKQESRAGRKMGHVTYVGRKSEELLKQALKERKGLRI